MGARKRLAIRELIYSYIDLKDGGATDEDLCSMAATIDIMLVAYEAGMDLEMEWVKARA